jgi:pilus assembly protein CpaB
VPGDLNGLYNPVYWLIGVAIFSAGAWTVRAIGVRTVSVDSWRNIAAITLIFAGLLTLPQSFTLGPRAQVVAQQPAVANIPVRARIVVARGTLAAGTPLGSDNVEMKDVATDAVQSNAATALTDVVGKSLIVPVAAGQQILFPYLATAVQPEAHDFADLVPAGKRAMSVTFSEPDAAGGLVAPGNYVDVIAVSKDHATVLLQNIKVLAADQHLPKGTPSAPSESTQFLTVILAVDPEAAERLALAENSGYLRYMVRSGADHTQTLVVPADLASLMIPAPVPAGQIIATEITPTNTKVGDTLDVKITVKNTSDKPLQTMGPAPGFTYVQGQTYVTQQFASDPGKWRVAISAEGLDSTEMPYRWGFGGDLAPGASTTVTGHIEITQDFKTSNFSAALVNEPNTIAQTGVAQITSLAKNTAVVAVDSGGRLSDVSAPSSRSNWLYLVPSVDRSP